MVSHNNTEKAYYFQKNVQGDVLAIYDEKKRMQCKYVYDAWGGHICTLLDGTQIYNSKTGITPGYEAHIGNFNAIRYRGYFYDTETKMYYLKARYYDPQVGRFISLDCIDVLSDTMHQMNGLNLYMYCGGNPIMNVDYDGMRWWRWVVGAVVIAAAIALTVATAGGFAVAGAAFAGALGIKTAKVAAGAIVVSKTTSLFAAAAVGATIAGGIGIISGGVTSAIQGGNFWDGAATGFMWGAIGGAIGGGIGSFGGARIVQATAQSVTQMAVYGVRVSLEPDERFTVLGLLSAGFAGFAGGSLINASVRGIQTTVNVMLAVQDVALTSLREILTDSWVERFFENLFGPRVWDLIW